MLKVTAENQDTNRQSGASYQRAGWELKYAPNPDSNLGQFLQTELEKHQDKPYFTSIIAELATFGLSSDWEAYCLGIKDKLTEEQA